MKYRISIQPRAAADMEAAYLWLAERSPTRAAKWYNGLQAAILSLEALPARCSLAPESDLFDREIRQHLYGKRPGVHRTLFTITDDQATILAIRHGARQFLQPEDLAGDN